jgi:hypothetical protein
MGEDVYATAAWPMWAASAGSVIVLALVGLLLVLAHREDPGAVVAPMLSGLAGGAITAAIAHPRSALPRDAANVFRRLFFADTAAAAVSCGALFAAVVLLLKLREARAILAVGLVTLGASLALCSSALSHARSLLAYRDLPFFVLRGRDDLHVGHERDVEVALARDPGRHWLFGWREEGPQILDDADQRAWHAPRTIRARAASSGRFPITAEAAAGPVRLKSTLWLEGKREIASPMLPLRVGNRWIYEAVTRDDPSRLLYVLEAGGGRSRGRFELEVLGAGERNGFRTFTLAARGSGLTRTAEVVAVEGKTLTIDANGNPGQPAIELLDPLPEASRVNCRIPLLGLAGRCQDGGAEADVPAKSPAKPRRGKRPNEPTPVVVPARFALAGPLWFHRSNGSTVNTLATGLVAALTIGLVIPSRGSTTSFALVETHRGPAGAPEAP